jgi:hypothetical protein
MIMGRKYSEFAMHAKQQMRMNKSSKERLKKTSLATYSQFHGRETNVVTNLFSNLFKKPMTLTKIIAYVIASLTVSTGVYASVAPESFARVSTSVATNIETFAEDIGVISSSNKTETTLQGQDNIIGSGQS